jgi:2-deoxy-D-gluconate 3-dehydrogenase
MNNLFDVSGKIILITGGTRGIGLEIVESLIQTNKIIIISKNCKNETFINYKNKEWNHETIQCDLSNKDEVEKLRYLECTPIDILINNAGNQERESFINYSAEQWDKDIQLLLSSVFRLSQIISKSMITHNKKGRIINVGSISSFQGAKNIVGYITAKHGIIGLTKAMAVELAQYGINVNCISPGMIDTDLLNKFEYDKDLIKRIPQQKLGKSEDIIGTILYLCSEASNYVTGVNIPIDGGWLSR